MKKSNLVNAFNQSLENKAQKAEAATTGKVTQASRQKKKSINAFIDPEAAKELKFLAVETGKTQQELFIEAINELLIKYGKKPLA
jgi:hypothetical protein